MHMYVVRRSGTVTPGSVTRSVWGASFPSSVPSGGDTGAVARARASREERRNSTSDAPWSSGPWYVGSSSSSGPDAHIMKVLRPRTMPMSSPFSS